MNMHECVCLIAITAGSNQQYDYDLIVIGGGSGGLACSKEGMRMLQYT